MPSRLERQLDRFQGVAEDPTIDAEVDRHSQHGPLEAADGVRPEGDPGPRHEVGVGDVVDVVIPAGDLLGPRAKVGDRPRDVPDEIDDPEGRQETPPVDLAGSPEE
jgi:hypothetical protein